MRKMAFIGLIVFNILGSVCSSIIEKEAIEKIAEVKINSRKEEN